MNGARKLLQRYFTTKSKSFDLQNAVQKLCRNRGFIYPGSEIYGGLANTFDYGPLGALMKNNIQSRWLYEFVQKRPNCYIFDSSILLHPNVWESSKHIEEFTDPMCVCLKCNMRARVDHLLENYVPSSTLSGLSSFELDSLLREHQIACPSCHTSSTFRATQHFNLLFRTNMGATDETCDWIYLRPETAQGAYINFKNVQKTMSEKLPFGIGQIGKSFRNEISPGHFIFRTREFEQLELEFFTSPEESKQYYHYWVQQCIDFLLSYGLDRNNIRKREHDENELAHYALATTDIEYKYPFGWKELWGITNRGDYDLSKHIAGSGKNLKYVDIHSKREFVPHVVEPALGLGRVMLALLYDAYDEEIVRGNARTVLRLHPDIAPYKLAILPLVKKDELVRIAETLYNDLIKEHSVDIAYNGSIGRRYRRQDEIGTPMCVTIDFETLADHKVTLRDRDTMEQKRIPIAEVLKIAGVQRDPLAYTSF